MPVGSDPSASPAPSRLPARFRPLGVRLAATMMGVSLLLVCSVIWIGFPDEVRASFTFLQRSTLVLIGLIIFSVGFGLARCRVDLDERGITVVNGYRHHRFEWGQLVAVSLRSGNPWAVLDLSDGTSQAVLAIQGSDGARAQHQVRRLRALIEASAGTEPPGGSPAVS